jgi:hypothetical protein
MPLFFNFEVYYILGKVTIFSAYSQTNYFEIQINRIIFGSKPWLNVYFPYLIIFIVKNSHDFQFMGVWYENVASIVTHNRVETYLSHMENP